MAPEIFKNDPVTGKPNYKRSVDIFALGLVFHVMLQFNEGNFFSASEKMMPLRAKLPPEIVDVRRESSARQQACTIWSFFK